MRLITLIVILLFSAAANPILGIDDIKKINSIDVDNLRADRSRLVMMEGHGSVIHYSPQVNSPFYTKPKRSPFEEKEYPDPWRRPRPKVLQTPIPGGAIATRQSREIPVDPQTQAPHTQKPLFEDIFERVQQQNQREESENQN